jgi:hypothetical protein
MIQTFSQNGHTIGSMWTLQRSWPFEKPYFLVVKVGVAMKEISLAKT